MLRSDQNAASTLTIALASAFFCSPLCLHPHPCPPPNRDCTRPLPSQLPPAACAAAKWPDTSWLGLGLGLGLGSGLGPGLGLGSGSGSGLGLGLVLWLGAAKWPGTSTQASPQHQSWPRLRLRVRLEHMQTTGLRLLPWLSARVKRGQSAHL